MFGRAFVHPAYIFKDTYHAWINTYVLYLLLGTYT